MTNRKIGTSEQLKDPNHEIPLGPRTALGIQHVLAMFASNVTPSIIIAGAAGFAFGGEDMVYLVQMAMLFAGVATLFQTIGFGPIGARLPVMQGTSFAFVGVLAGVAATQGLSVALTACLIAGIIHFALGSVIQKLRFMFPPLVTGLVILAIGLYLIPVAIKYAAGGAADFQMAAEMMQGPNESVLTNDDVAVEDSSFTTGRRGVAATVLVEKIVGSLAESGGSLQECKALGDKVNQNSGSMGVAFSSCTVPAAGKPTFELGADEMEFGVGIHGEPGRRRDKIKPAQDITNELLEAIIEDLKPNSNEETLLFVNGMGGTPLTELYLVFDNAKKLLDSKNIKISRSLVGNFCTSLEMQGASITLTKLDEEIMKHWDSKVHTAAMRWGM